MQRRARIKAVANLSNVRRGANKNNSENQESEITFKKDTNDDIQEQSSSVEQPDTNEIIDKESKLVNDRVKNVDDVNKKNDFLEKVNETSNKADGISQPAQEDGAKKSLVAEKDVKVKAEKFKSPEKVTPRAENEISSGSKFRKPKITPKLNISRAAAKVQENEEKQKNNETSTCIESPMLSPVYERPPESPINVFSPPAAPFSPAPQRTPRCETPREITDSPGLIINHNIHHPATPQSPFYPIPHQRIRTESLCSIKSTTVANLQPRKKVRTEDQKILDNKRESRERLSNKKIEKSKLRMFDMIYYNPTTNPMKPRESIPAKDKPPKKPIDLTMDLPPHLESTVEQAPIPVPQLRLNANGEMVLDEASLVVENEEQKKNRILLANTNVVYHDELSGSYGYYKRQQRTKEWPQEETIKFYRCLNTVGTDFSLMLNLFPNRSRRDLKLKFKKEEKNNPNLVDKALLHHNTFNIEELQRELEEEDEMRRKEAESKTSDVKELVKRKILKKQEAKAKARQQQDKAKIEKILTDGDLILNYVDNTTQDVKENLEKTVDETAGKRKRAPKRKNIKPEPHMEFKKIMLHSQINSAISVGELKSSTTIDSNIEPPFIKEPPEHKSAVVVTESAPFVHRNELTPLESTDSFEDRPETSKIFAKSEKDVESSTIINEISKDTQIDSEEQDSMLSKTGKFISELITDCYRENINDYMMDEDENVQCNLINVKKEETAQKQTIQEVPSQSDENQAIITSSITDDKEQDMDVEENEQAILDADPSVMCMEPEPPLITIASSHVQLSFGSSLMPIESSVLSVEASYPAEIADDPSRVSVESTYNAVMSIDSYADQLNNEELSMEPTTSQCIEPSETVDDETFLNSLDLERLVIVVKQIDGEDIYDIHETEADSEKLSEKPLNLPRHIVDLIVSAMTQDD